MIRVFSCWQTTRDALLYVGLFDNHWLETNSEFLMGVLRDFLHRLFGTTRSYQGRQEGERVISPSFHDWSQADHVTVEMTTPNEPGHGRIELQSTALGDAQINFESRTDREMHKGTILLVSGGWMATKDLAL